MQRRFSRRKLGPKFSEAARQLWLALEERGWGQNEAMRQLVLPSGQISKLLYGERKAGRIWSRRIQEQLGIDEGLWDVPPTVAFIPPAARSARKSSPTPKRRSPKVRKASLAVKPATKAVSPKAKAAA
jgi:hypothetical protein